MSTVASFFWAKAAVAQTTVALSDDALQHALVRRLVAGDAVRLVSGRGTAALGTVASATKRSVVVDITMVEDVPRPIALEMLVPVADRDRMLWAAEKCVEHQVTAWRPVMYRRSRSVSPRGEGGKFREKVAARMCAALEQCGGAWLPEIHVEVELADAVTAVARHQHRLMLDAAGGSLAGMAVREALAMAVGPEGGFEEDERRQLRDAGWRAASLGTSTLRFETAIVSGAAVVRAGQLTIRS